jgi:hypothetical protein
VIFEDTFQTVHLLPSNKPIHEQWKDILKFGRECFAEMDYNDNGEPMLPKLSDIIKTFRDERNQRLQQVALPPLSEEHGYDQVDNNILVPFDTQFHPPQDESHAPPAPNNPAIPIPLSSTFSGGDNPVIGGDNAVPGGDTAVADNGRPCGNVGTYKDGPAKIRRLPIDGESYELAYLVDVSFNSIYPIPAITNKACRLLNYHPEEKLQKRFLAECYFLQDKWFQESDCFSSLADHMSIDTWDNGNDGIYFNDIADPCILEACSVTKKAKETDDAPLFHTAIRSPFQAQWWEVMYNELVTIMVDFDCWDYIKRTPDMNILPSTWAFKLKRYPDGRVKKFKARFCARGDRQKEGIDYFETWAPVVQWSTVRIVMILAIKLKLI